MSKAFLEEVRRLMAYHEVDKGGINDDDLAVKMAEKLIAIDDLIQKYYNDERDMTIICDIRKILEEVKQ